MPTHTPPPPIGLVGKLVLGILPLGFAVWTVRSILGRLRTIRDFPDLNGDGKFSVLDVPSAVAAMLLEVGHRYQALIADSKVGPFLEMRSEDPNMMWSIALAAFAYVMIGAGVLILFEEDPKK